MKYFTIPFTMLAIVFVGCDSETNPGLESLNYYTDSKTILEYPYVSEGDSTVIHRYYVAEEKENIADDEYAEDVFFQIPSGIDSFEYLDEEINGLNFLFKQYCFCGPIEGVSIESGKVDGTKTLDRWNVNVDMNVRFVFRYDEDSTFLNPQVNSIKFSGNFKSAERPTGN